MATLFAPRRVASSPRYLATRHARRVLATNRRAMLGTTGAGADDDDDTPPELAPGEEQLYSFYLPALPAGPHIITTKQTVTAGSASLLLTGSQPFNIVAPQFALPDGSIHSVYPPQGHGDTVEILPHVVLMDPHLPWERIASEAQDPDHDKNRVPWLAVLVFTQEELRVTDAAVWGSISPVPVQSETLSVNLALADLEKGGFVTPVKSRDAETKTDFVLIPGGLFNELFTDYQLPAGTTQTKASVSRYKWLAHVRNINTTGMASSGIMEEEKGLFSIVVSHRVGPLTITQPTAVVVHLVSVEGVEGLSFPAAATKPVALCSLFSWGYTCLPPSSLNVADAFSHIGATLDVLRPEQATLKHLLEPSQPPEAARIAQRMSDGYTLTKYRTQTGEITAALIRGPLAPTLVEHQWKPMSHFGTDLQVLDRTLGIMDITYSVAWQVGKTLALADTSFTTALARVRTEITREGLQGAKKTVLEAAGVVHKTRADTLRGLSAAVEGLAGRGRGEATLQRAALTRGPETRWRRAETSVPQMAFDSAGIIAAFDSHARPAAVALASATEGGVYNELNTHSSADWKTVFSWVLDRLYLHGIPAQYLIPDPAHAPAESLRFFHIDANWIEALVDGALSVANHVDREDDSVRRAIKSAINDYLTTPMAGVGYPPQVPTHGFLLRSELVTKFPDLIVEAPVPAASKHLGAAILRQENISESVMFALFDRVPGSEDFDSLIFRQPPHQQSFAAGASLDVDHLKTEYKQIFTKPNLPPDPDGDRKIPLDSKTFKPADADSPFIWGAQNEVRTLKLPQWAQDVWQVEQNNRSSDFSEPKPTAAMAGIQLNNPMWFLEIRLTARPLNLTKDAGMRTLNMLSARVKRTARAQVRSLSAAPDTTDYAALLPTPAQRVRPPFLAAGLWGKGKGIEVDEDEQEQVHEYLLPSAPHIRALQKTPTASLGDGPAGEPKFDYYVHPLGVEGDQVPMLPNMPQDLIFSIVLKQGTADDYQLKEISFSVRTGKTTAERKNLMLDYRGPGATMLSNLRFNVLPVNGANNMLVIRLLPRSTDEWVKVAFLNEMSFVLSGVIVNEYQEDVKVVTELVEKYYNSGDIKSQFKINLVKPPKSQ